MAERMMWGAPDWVLWCAIVLLAGFGLRAYVVMARVIDAMFSEDGDQPVARVRLHALRRGIRWGGCFVFTMGLLLVSTNVANAIGPLGVGILMIVTPAWQAPALVKIFIPIGDHEKPMGPRTALGHFESSERHHYDRQQGPMTLQQWLETED